MKKNIDLKSLLEVLNNSFALTTIYDSVPIIYSPGWVPDDIYFWSSVEYYVTGIHFDPSEFSWIVHIIEK